jgi:hypothetical protein
MREAPMTTIKLLRDTAYAPCCYIIARQRDDGTFDACDEANTVLVQSEWDFSAVAGAFGMPWGDETCAHRGTDGTVDCPECGTTAEIFIDTAAHWLAEHVGATAKDPGYFE